MMTPASPSLNLDPKLLVGRLGIVPGAHVGDFGVGGSGQFVGALASAAGQNGEVLLFDVVKSALSSAMSTAQLQGWKNCKAVWCNLEIYEGARGVGQNSLDAGVLINVLHQTKKQRDMLTEIHRMLKPGAKLLVVDWQPDADHSVAPPTEQRVAADHINMLGRSLGFAPADSFAASALEWGLVIVKT